MVTAIKKLKDSRPKVMCRQPTFDGTGETGLSSPMRDNVHVLYVISRKHHGKEEFLHIDGFSQLPWQAMGLHVEGAQTSWGDLAGASEWIVEKDGNSEVVIKKLVGKRWVFAGGWRVGLEAAEYLLQKYPDAMLVPTIPAEFSTGVRSCA